MCGPDCSCYPCYPCFYYCCCSTSEVIQVNVGGQRFTTLKSTINQESSSRLSLICRGVLPSSKDSLGYIFIDREPKYFQLILNYLRDGTCVLPQAESELDELEREIRFYQLFQMQQWFESKKQLQKSTMDFKGMGDGEVDGVNVKSQEEKVKSLLKIQHLHHLPHHRPYPQNPWYFFTITSWIQTITTFKTTNRTVFLFPTHPTQTPLTATHTYHPSNNLKLIKNIWVPDRQKYIRESLQNSEGPPYKSNSILKRILD
eukprot:TRINITY_DN108946_c0_g1_i1.p2 TRINITY_DN108946_c0_g1~~TRINITY_DN108946_c0_g1_i1.p2  ORF type:complete len:258 (-),score=10.32 TRINITY_DN108946_c0_g1_i1:277-1050(-)